jgi:hypothetical protein
MSKKALFMIDFFLKLLVKYYSFQGHCEGVRSLKKIFAQVCKPAGNRWLVFAGFSKFCRRRVSATGCIIGYKRRQAVRSRKKY